MSEEYLTYRIVFKQQDKIYELYANYLTEGALVGFIEVEELVFNTKSGMVVDPVEERLKKEFNGVERSYIPIHSILRIDEVAKEGTVKIRDSAKLTGKIEKFPRSFQPPSNEDK